ncbi:MAG: tRNA 2-thiouridine(34) synthase MnmA [Acetobacteraceae bacterium]|nr:tRNA 2-thiouridine(34) synthase MnmA [Acetobacteraceae bacterium]
MAEAGLVAVAMSGGVDSSMAALLLKEAGYRVVGLTMRLWPPAGAPGAVGACDDGGAAGDHEAAADFARRVAEWLGVPHHVVDLSEPFSREVVEPFSAEYGAGRTPNPCVICNRRIKFGALWLAARGLGAGRLATGHYARVQYDDRRRRWLLLRGVDRAKDQSYVLYGLSQAQLAGALFPLGGRTKAEVRGLAAEVGLPAAHRAESQEICFLGGAGYRAFLEARGGPGLSPGPILDTAGRRLGTHRGLAFYTVGQRRWLGLAAGEPRYVVRLDPAQNALIVGRPEELDAGWLVARGVNLIALERLDAPLRLRVRTRYRGPEAWAVVRPLKAEALGAQEAGHTAGEPGGQGLAVVVEFESPQRAVAPGQSAVFYDGQVVVGGGVIVEAGGMRSSRPTLAIDG